MTKFYGYEHTFVNIFDILGVPNGAPFCLQIIGLQKGNLDVTMLCREYYRDLCRLRKSQAVLVSKL